VVRWKCIGITIKAASDVMAPLVRATVEVATAMGAEVALEHDVSRLLGSGSGHSLEDVANRADLMIVLGGDGTVLSTARAIGQRDVPILGINLGRLGFLADVRPDEVESALRAVLEGDYGIESRTRLSVTRITADGDDAPLHVLNDAVITGALGVARMLDLEMRVNGNPMGSFRADGLIVCTPTGSTAYNLGAGGSILDPSAPVLSLTPICPQASNQQRPIVLADDCLVEVQLPAHHLGILTLDGQVGVPLHGGEGIRVTRSPHPVRFVRLRGYDYFETLRSKLLWGSR
jgi:NAD+ kinase